ncbi:MAG: ArnT family glycosyltransferase [Acidobacteriota bacterium]
MNEPRPPLQRRSLMPALSSSWTVGVASATSLVLGLFFLFVWSPLPWGWEGIDHYHDRAVRLAAGEPFDTTDVPWGYAYYLACFYVIFGPHPWIPLVAQVLLNAGVPVLLYQLVRRLADQRLAALSALLVGVFSFNTVYASTQSSDAVCTVLLLVSLLAFDYGRRSGALAGYAVSGLLAGLMAQFRPNLLLFAPFLALAHLLAGRGRPRTLVEIGAYLSIAGLALAPWVVRNYRLTSSFLPSSTHGGIQLWYGTLQTGPYLESRAYNPRSWFGESTFPYTSLDGLPIVVSAGPLCPAWTRTDATLVFWTDRQPVRTRLAPVVRSADAIGFEIPGQPAPTAVYYYVEAKGGPPGGPTATVYTPARGPDAPFVVFVSHDHLGDLDAHHDFADVMDLVRLLRHLTWDEPPPDMRLDADRDGRLTERDLRALAAALVTEVDRHVGPDPVDVIESTSSQATLRLRDGSTLTVPRAPIDRLTDLSVDGEGAVRLLYARRPMSTWDQGEPADTSGQPCWSFERVAVNEVFYRREPHLMRRYTALAFDNIRREPVMFAAASLYRMIRLFIIRGSGDVKTAQQFGGSSAIYAIGLVVSSSVFLLFLVGAFIAHRSRSPVRWLLLPVVYVPLTISVVLTNMRYTVSVQPYVFVFVAVALLWVFDRDRKGRARRGGLHQGDAGRLTASRT